MDKILHDPKDPNYGNYGIFLIMGNAGFCPSTVSLQVPDQAQPRAQTSNRIEALHGMM